MSEAKDAVRSLTISMRRAMFTRDRQGSYSLRTFERLVAAGLVDEEFRWTRLGREVRALLGVNDDD